MNEEISPLPRGKSHVPQFVFLSMSISCILQLGCNRSETTHALEHEPSGGQVADTLHESSVPPSPPGDDDGSHRTYTDWQTPEEKRNLADFGDEFFKAVRRPDQRGLDEFMLSIAHVDKWLTTAEFHDPSKAKRFRETLNRDISTLKPRVDKSVARLIEAAKRARLDLSNAELVDVKPLGWRVEERAPVQVVESLRLVFVANEEPGVRYMIEAGPALKLSDRWFFISGWSDLTRVD
jgi:hypothetical protein